MTQDLKAENGSSAGCGERAAEFSAIVDTDDLIGKREHFCRDAAFFSTYNQQDRLFEICLIKPDGVTNTCANDLVAKLTAELDALDRVACKDG